MSVHVRVRVCVYAVEYTREWVTDARTFACYFAREHSFVLRIMRVKSHNGTTL